MQTIICSDCRKFYTKQVKRKCVDGKYRCPGCLSRAKDNLSKGVN